GAEAARAAIAPEGVQNTAALGLLIYDKYILLFQLAGLILLVAMIGAIMLTLRHRRDIKRQDVLQQMWRDPAKAMELKDVKPGQGL
ncbi:NADH-ubiquinone oxidoreductase chain J, partial [hydrothermal vent metagenome]